MAIPGIKATQSALDSYKASRGLCEGPKKVISAAEAAAEKAATESAAFVRKPINKNTIDNSLVEDGISYAVAHGTPENVAKELDVTI